MVPSSPAFVASQDLIVFAGDPVCDVELVGGKGASLLELVRAGFPVPPFFVLTTKAWQLARAVDVEQSQIACAVEAESREPGQSQFPPQLRALLASAYSRLGSGVVAVRSSAVAEDSHEASFAGQQETILGVEGVEAICRAVQKCWASAESERARAYRCAWGSKATLPLAFTATIPGDQAGDRSSLSDAPALRDPQAREAEASDSRSDRNFRRDSRQEAFPMAVVIQRLVDAEVAGVLFTRDPTDPTGNHLLVEAAWGLAEGVVSGKVMPDRFRVHRVDGTLIQQEIAEKRYRVGRSGLETVPEAHRSQPCLTPEQLAQLAQLALHVERHYGEPRDIEWAWVDGQFWLLQARPITTVSAWEREEYRQKEIARLRQLADPRGTVWARYNLAESLTVPTPMTWAVLCRFMSGRGGYGCLLRDVGFDPDPRLDEEGFLDLVAGRPYVNLSREPLCYFRFFPYYYPFATLKADPTRALYPKPQPDWSRLSWRFWLHLPVTFWKMLRQAIQLNRLAAELPQRLREEVYPKFAQTVQAARSEKLTGLSDRAVWERFREWEQYTLTEFARQALLPTVVLGHLLGTLEHSLRRFVGASDAAQEVRLLLTGVSPDPEADVARGLEQLARNELPLDAFLRQFGHRGELEMELAQPRWEENPQALLARVGTRFRLTQEPASANSATTSTHVPGDYSLDAHQAEASTRDTSVFERIWSELVQRARIPQAQQSALRQLVEQARQCAALRETSRHYFLLGYSLLRQCLVELGRRWQLGDGIFFLTPDEIEAFLSGRSLWPGEIPETFHSSPTASQLEKQGDGQQAALALTAMRTWIRQRRRQRQIALTLELPVVLFSDDLEAIGRPIRIRDAEVIRGIAVSPGVAEGPALVLTEPHCPAHENLPKTGYVLVCPSTDPAWVPLFLNARALVMETGGVLSHGAIVAREFGLPAVAGITDACRQFQSGQLLRVNGNTGEVQRLSTAASPS